jgi:hypothetical protein
VDDFAMRLDASLERVGRERIAGVNR